VGLGSIAATPFRARGVETALVGQRAGAKRLARQVVGGGIDVDREGREVVLGGGDKRIERQRRTTTRSNSPLIRTPYCQTNRSHTVLP